MNPVLLITIGLMICSDFAFSQCPQRDLKVIGADCKPPRDLSVASATCSSLNVKWKGDNNQAFILNAGYIKGNSDSVIEIETLKISAGNSGNCTASVPVKEGMVIKWNVQAICSVNSVRMYSHTTDGPATTIHSCAFEPDTLKTNGVHVFPNPASTYLLVAIDEKVTGSAWFKIYDVNGKKVYDKLSAEVTKMNSEYKLNLPNLAAGNYLIEMRYNRKINRSKFMVMKN